MQMQQHSSVLPTSIAANKFYPPRIKASQAIARYPLISTRLQSDQADEKLIVVEAQAGQGKTTLVHQFLKNHHHPYIWYQMSDDDRDPVYFLSALLQAFSPHLDDFTSSQLTDIINNSQVGPMDLQGLVTILLNDLETHLDGHWYLVLDDVHLINDARLSVEVLTHLIDASPQSLGFILATRHPLTVTARALRDNPHLIYLDTKDLALGVQDIEQLYHDILNIPISRTQATDIRAVTHGWIMGIVLAAHPLTAEKKKRRVTGMPHFPEAGTDTNILSYFEVEIFSQVPAHLHETFLKLAFLDEIDVSMFTRLGVAEDARHQLMEMADTNFFIYRLDEVNQTFRFHHLFQDFLQIQARRMLEKSVIDTIHRQAAAHYLANDLIDKALKSLRNAEDYHGMELLLKQHGLTLLARNRTMTILAVLQTIPEDILQEHGWLSFFYGLLAIDTAPGHIMPFLQTARRQFHERGELFGELMALTQMIYFHFAVTGYYRAGAELLDRTRLLLEQSIDQLPPEITIIAARNLAAGYCFFTGEMGTARQYGELSLNLAISKKSKNFQASTRWILGFIGLLSGNRHDVFSQIEASYPLSYDPLVSASNRLLLKLLQLTVLVMDGAFAVVDKRIEASKARLGQNIVRQTVAAPFIYIYSAITMVSTGRASEAIVQIEEGMQVSATAASPHMTSQFLQWRAFARAILGHKERAIADIEQSAKLRETAGSPYYLAQNHALHGATLAILKKFEQAEVLLRQAQHEAEAISCPSVVMCALAYRAWIAHKQHNNEDLARLSAELLKLMQTHGYTFFYGWEPTIMNTLLSAAYHRDVEPEFAQSCLQSRLLCTPIGADETLPLLTINILGTFCVGQAGGTSLEITDFSGTQRELLGLLISSPEQSVSQDQIQLTFWPDSDPDKARKAADTLISRFRKTMATSLSVPVKHYLQVEKGYVRLTNVTIDGVLFLALGKKGLHHAGRQQWWQAENLFTEAYSCWHQMKWIEHFRYDQAVAFGEEIIALMRDICLSWGNLLLSHGQFDEALAICTHTEHLLTMDEDCVALRYRLYLLNKAPIKARELLGSYRRELIQLGYEKDEAEEMISDLVRENDEKSFSD